MSEAKHKCCEKVWPPGAYRSYQCGKGANYEHEGKHYCKTHHPPTVKAKRDERQQKMNDHWDAMKAAREEAAAILTEQKRRADAYEGLIALNANLVSVLKGALHCVHSEGHPFRHWHLEAANVLERAAQQTKEDSHE